jgi:hypothetical protein
MCLVFSEAQANCIFRCNIRELSKIAEGRGESGCRLGAERWRYDALAGLADRGLYSCMSEGARLGRARINAFHFKPPSELKTQFMASDL